MKYLPIVAVVIGAVAVMTCSNISPAAAGDNFSFSFDTSGVAFAYTDGYWDQSHNWHKWHSAREAREYRTRFADHYHAKKHTREQNQGWRDRDGDGVPNDRDRSPDNAHRQ